MTTTRAYVLEKPNAPFVLRDVVLDELQPTEVLVEMKYTGLCHTVCSLLIRSIVASLKHGILIRYQYTGYRRPRRRYANRPLSRRFGP